MKRINTKKQKILSVKIAILLLLYPCFIFAQKIESSADKRNILIGEQIQYTVKASFPATAYRVNWFNLPDSFAHFEVIEKSKIDTSTKNSITTLQQIITYTSFDSGKWAIPALLIQFDPVSGGTGINLFTDSIPVSVLYSPADSTNQLRDIKPIIEVSNNSYFWYYVAAGCIIVLLIILLLYKYFKKRKTTGTELFASTLSPYKEAMQQLDELAKYPLANTEEIKMFYIKISTILKRYLGRKQNKNLSNKTTTDLLIEISGNNFSQDILSSLAALLRYCDVVKFAKYLPKVLESKEHLEKTREIIYLTEQKFTQQTAQYKNNK